MVEMIGRVSRGSKMDQIYLPKNRSGFASGEYVLISLLAGKKVVGEDKEKIKPYFYNASGLEPLKVRVAEEIFKVIDKKLDVENIIITGSFLEKGFGFKDIDVLIIGEQRFNIDLIKKEIESLYGIAAHILVMSRKDLSYGLAVDPLYNLMLSKCISKNRLIFRVKREINYKLLDLNLLKSKTLIENFSILNGSEKYYFILNMISILLFIQGKKLSKDIVNKEIERIFEIKINEIRDNIIEKENFLKRYKEIFNSTFNLILRSIKKEGNNEPK